MLMIPPRITTMRPHPTQMAWINSGARFHVIPAGRRSGKTEIAKRKILQRALSVVCDYDDPRFFAAAPTRDQAKAIFWGDLKAMATPVLATPPRETDLCLSLVNGAEIFVIGMDRPERIEGRSWDGGVLDEFANMKSHAFSENVRPALSDRRGWCDLIGVPEGRNHYYDLWKYAISGVDPEWAGHTWPSEDILPPEEVAAAKRVLDELTFEQEYRGSFINFEGRCYYPFLEETHCAPLAYNPNAPLIFCFDFNVDPGIAVVAQEQELPNGEYGTGVIGEVHIPRNSNTPAVCRKLVADWHEHQHYVICYGDATGGSRGSAKVDGSDWDLIKTTLREGFAQEQLVFKVPDSNPPERARINAMNTRLKSGDGAIRLMVDPSRAPNTVKDLEGVRLLEGGSGEIDKKSDRRLSHLSDGLGYYVVAEFPIVQRVAQMRPMF